MTREKKTGVRQQDGREISQFTLCTFLIFTKSRYWGGVQGALPGAGNVLGPGLMAAMWAST